MNIPFRPTQKSRIEDPGGVILQSMRWGKQVVSCKVTATVTMFAMSAGTVTKSKMEGRFQNAAIEVIEVTPLYVTPPVGSSFAAPAGNAGVFASSARPELSGGAESMTVPEGLLVQAATVLARSPVDSAITVVFPSFRAILGLRGWCHCLV